MFKRLFAMAVAWAWETLIQRCLAFATPVTWAWETLIQCWLAFA